MTDLTRHPRADLTCDEVRDLAAAFVLDALDADEADAVRVHLSSCDDAHAEIAELASALPVLAASVAAVQPPAGLKSRILAAAAADLEARGRPAVTSVPGPAVPAAVAPAAAAAPTPTPIVFPTAAQREARTAARGRGSVGSWALRIAAVLAIAFLGSWNLLLQGQLDQSQTYEQNVAAVLDAAGETGALTAFLTADGGAGPSGLAAVGADGAVTLAMHDLTPTTGDQVYSVWVIGGDGKPMPLGSFQVGQAGTAYFQDVGLPTDPGIVLALTLEPAPGATTPTLPIVSLGTATAAG